MCGLIHILKLESTECELVLSTRPSHAHRQVQVQEGNKLGHHVYTHRLFAVSRAETASIHLFMTEQVYIYVVCSQFLIVSM